MRIGIIGLPSSGRTTVFNALTRGRAPTGPQSGRGGRAGVAHVPDDRLAELSAMLNTPAAVQAEITFVDLPETRGEAGGELFSGEKINQLQRVDALLAVVRAFEDDSVPHSDGSVDWRRDLEKLLFDVTFADVALMERRIDRIGESMKGMRSAERASALETIDTLRGIQGRLEEGVPIRAQEMAQAGSPALRDVFLLSSLPFLVTLNIGENDLTGSAGLESEIEDSLTGPLTGGVAISGLLEMELAQMDLEEEADMRSGLEAGQSGLSRMVRLSYDVLGLITFYTSNEKEVRAWPVPQGAGAPTAAGRVHTDMERGFIRAEVIGYGDLLRCGSFAEARKQGALRQEGRDYQVNDGDVINFLFSV